MGFVVGLTGFALAVSLVGGVAVSEVELVGSPPMELSVGLGTDGLGVVAGAVVSDDAVCEAEGEASGCAEALAEAGGETEADAEVLTSGDRLFLLGLDVVGCTASRQLLGLEAEGEGCSFFLWSGALVGTGSLFRMSGLMESGMTPASLAAQRPPASRPIAAQSTRTLPANSN